TASPVIRSTRNFLRENRQMVSQPLKMILGVSEAWKTDRDREQRWPLRSHNYELPTAASLARRTGPSPLFLAEAQRRLMGGSRLRISRRGYSEKEIQTEDISDERFLSAALLKCSSAEHQSRSEGDEPSDGGGSAESAMRLRRTASNFELGRLAEQRDAYQPGQYTLLRPLGGLLGIVPGALDQLGRPPPDQDTASVCSPSSRENSPCVRQMAIPEVTDVVDQEDALSVDSQQQDLLASSSSSPQTPQKTEKDHPKEPEQVPEIQQAVEFQKPKNGGLVLLAEEQRLELLEEARERQAQLIAEYNRLPISMGTLRVRNLKIILEQQLDVVDNDLSVLSQPKVYV
ncbi:hypothetical protein KR067_009902, partial [Drosophila pandora]